MRPFASDRLSIAVVVSLLSVTNAIPFDQNLSNLEVRENACIALGNCPGLDTPRSTTAAQSTTTPPPPPPTATATEASATSVTASPTTSPTLTIQRAAMKPRLYKCNSKQKKTIQDAWNDAGALAQSHAEWEPPGWFTKAKWQDAMNLYIGADSAKDNGWFGSTGKVKANVLRQKGIHFDDDDWSPGWSYAYLYCDASGLKYDSCKPGVFAYTWDDNGLVWNAKYVVLCPDFFKDENTLSSFTEQAKSRPELQATIDPWFYLPGISLFHETYHWNPEVSQPKCNLRPEVYAGTDVVNLAKTDYSSSIINAESYTDAALAIYMQKTFNRDKPPTPLGLASADIQSALTEFASPRNQTTEFLDGPPEGFVPPVKNHDILSLFPNPDPTEEGWELLF